MSFALPSSYLTETEVYLDGVKLSAVPHLSECLGKESTSYLTSLFTGYEFEITPHNWSADPLKFMVVTTNGCKVVLHTETFQDGIQPLLDQYFNPEQQSNTAPYAGILTVMYGGVTDGAFLGDVQVNWTNLDRCAVWESKFSNIPQDTVNVTYTGLYAVGADITNCHLSRNGYVANSWLLNSVIDNDIDDRGETALGFQVEGSHIIDTTIQGSEITSVSGCSLHECSFEHLGFLQLVGQDLRNVKLKHKSISIQDKFSLFDVTLPYLTVHFFTDLAEGWCAYAPDRARSYDMGDPFDAELFCADVTRIIRDQQGEEPDEEIELGCLDYILDSLHSRKELMKFIKERSG